MRSGTKSFTLSFGIATAGGLRCNHWCPESLSLKKKLTLLTLLIKAYRRGFKPFNSLGDRLGRSQISNPEGGDGSSSTGISFDELSWFGPLVFFGRVVNSPDFMLERFVREENHWHFLLKDEMSTYQEASHNRQEIQFFFCSFCIAMLFRYFTKCQCAVWFMFCSKLKVSQCCSIYWCHRPTSYEQWSGSSKEFSKYPLEMANHSWQIRFQRYPCVLRGPSCLGIVDHQYPRDSIVWKAQWFRVS